MGSGRVFWLVLGFVWLGASSCAVTPGESAGSGFRVVSISPSGAVDDRDVTQLRVTFSEPIIPTEGAGATDFRPPIEVEPALPCAWRMAGARRLTCDLPRNSLQPATRYEVQVSSGFQSANGARLEHTYVETFSTRRPKINRVDDHKNGWKSPTRPILSIATNQDVLDESLEEHLQFVLEDGTRVAADVQAEASRGNSGNAKWKVIPRTDLPEGSTAEFRLADGLESAHGPLPGESQKLATIEIAEAFRFLGLSCEQESITRGSACDPRKGIFLHFSAPPESENLEETVRSALVSSDGKSAKWTVGAPRKTNRRSWRLPATFSSHTAIRVKDIPAGQTIRLQGPVLHDVFGRRLENAFSGEIRVADHDPQVVVDDPVVITPSLDSAPYGWSRNVRTLALLTKAMPPGEPRGTEFVVFDNGQIDNEHHATLLERLSYRQVEEPWLRAALFDRSSPDDTARDFSIFRASFNLTAFTGPEGLTVWTLEWAGTEPIADVSVELFLRDTESDKTRETLLARDRTDSDGMATFPAPRDLLEEVNTDSGEAGILEFVNRLVIRATHNSRTSVLPIGQRWFRNMNDYREPQKFRPWHLERQYVSWGTTDKHLYRAGETVRFQLYLSETRNGNLVPADAGPVDLVLVSEIEEPIAALQDVEIDGRGGFAGRITIPKDVAGGEYVLQIQDDSNVRNWNVPTLWITVSDFDKRDFRTSLRTPEHLIRQGETFGIKSVTQRLNGGAYGNTEAVVAVRAVERDLAEDHPHLSDFTFLPPEATRGRLRHSRRETSTTYHEGWSLDKRGTLEKSVKAPETDIPYGEVKVSVGVKNRDGELVYTPANTIPMANHTRFVGLKTASTYALTHHPLTTETVVVDERGQSVDDAEARVALERFVSDTDTWKHVDGCHVDTARGTCQVTPESSGLHRIVAKTPTGAGASHRSAVSLFAFPGKDTDKSTGQRDATPFEVITDRDEYTVGDTATIRFANPFDKARALVVLSREEVVETRQFPAHPGINELTLPLDRKHAPNIDISVVLVSRLADQDKLEGEITAASRTRIKVDDSEYLPTVSVDTDQDVYQPGEPSEIQIEVRNQHGAVANADLTVAVVDSGLVELLENGLETFNPIPDLTEIRRDSGGMQMTSLAIGVYGGWLIGDMPNQVYASFSRGLERVRVTGSRIDRRDLFPAQSPSGSRQHFRDVAAWETDLTTDAEGRARTTIDLPGNLTEWTIVALTVTPEMRVGFGSQEIDTQQTLETRLSLPDSAYSGDSFTATATVFNRGSEAHQIRGSWYLDGDKGMPDGPKSVRATIPAGGRSHFRLPVTMGDSDLSFSFTVRDESGLSDRIKKAVTKRVSHVPVTTSRFGSVVNEHNIHLEVHDQRIGSSDLKLTLNPSLLGQIDPAISYNIEYPHRCWEQELSRAVSHAVQEALRQRQGDSPSPEARKAINDILSRAYSYQGASGEFSFFSDNPLSRSPWLTAYTVVAFSWLSEMGYEPPAGIGAKAADYLVEPWAKTESKDSEYRARTHRILSFLLTVPKNQTSLLSSSTRESAMEILETDSTWSLPGHIFMLQALAGDAGHDKHLAQIRNELRIEPSTASIGDIRRGYFLSPATALDCHLLTGLSRLEARGTGAPGLTERLANNIVKKGETQGHWGNTHANAVCAWSLYRYAEAYEDDAPPSEVEALLNGSRLGRAKWDSLDGQPVSFHSSVDESDSAAKVAFSSPDEGRAYYAITMESMLPYSSVAGRSRGLWLTREYSTLVDEEWKILEPGDYVAPGQIVRVSLRVETPAFRRFVVLEDSVPAGLDPINPDLAEGHILEAAGYADDARMGWPFSSPYYGDSKVRSYATYLWPGVHQFTYYTQAGIEGEFQAPPAHIEVMYEPENHAYSELHRIRVKQTK